MRILRGLRKQPSATIACWASNWTSSAFRNWLARDSSSASKRRMIRKIMEDWMRDECIKRGYQLVYTPHVARSTCGRPRTRRLLRGQHVHAHGTGRCELSDEADELPVHILIYKNSPKSYRDLPVRYAELGNVYRYERSGTMHGLLRVRGLRRTTRTSSACLRRLRVKWQRALILPRRC